MDLTGSLSQACIVLQTAPHPNLAVTHILSLGGAFEPAILRLVNPTVEQPLACVIEVTVRDGATLNTAKNPLLQPTPRLSSAPGVIAQASLAP